LPATEQGAQGVAFAIDDPNNPFKHCLNFEVNQNAGATQKPPLDIEYQIGPKQLRYARLYEVNIPALGTLRVGQPFRQAPAKAVSFQFVDRTGHHDQVSPMNSSVVYHVLTKDL
jgi:hypothetical protein